jgi:hypothetical protein
MYGRPLVNRQSESFDNLVQCLKIGVLDIIDFFLGDAYAPHLWEYAMA